MRGDRVGIIGPNGSGKTSLLKTICGLIVPESGDILWRGAGAGRNEEFRREFAYLGHLDGLKDGLSVFENLGFYQRLTAVRDDSALDRALAELNLLQYADTPTYKLSFGQRRRLAFGRLLLSWLPLWILDEPFTGVDMAGRQLMQDICAQHLGQGGTIVMTNHTSLDDTVLANNIRVLTL